MDILQFSIHFAWLENHHQVIARSTGQTISYMAMVSPCVTHFLQKKQCQVFGPGGLTVYASGCKVSAKFSMSIRKTNHAFYTELLLIKAVSLNEVFDNLYGKSSRHHHGYLSGGISRTGFKAPFVFAAHIPGSQNTVRRSASMKITNKTRNAACMTGLAGASDGMRG